MTAEPKRPVLFTLAEAAIYLHTSERHLQRMTQDRKIGYHKVGMYVRFNQADLDSYLTSTYTPTA